jgi:hypothetical protein
MASATLMTHHDDDGEDGEDITNTNPVRVSRLICDDGPSYRSLIIAPQRPVSCQCL